MAHRNRWFTWVYLLKAVIFHGYVTNNQMVWYPPCLNHIPCLDPMEKRAKTTSISFWNRGLLTVAPGFMCHPSRPTPPLWYPGEPWGAGCCWNHEESGQLINHKDNGDMKKPWRKLWSYEETFKYPLVKEHNYGKSQLLLGKSTINGHVQ